MIPKTTVETLFLRYRARGDARALGEVFDRTAPEVLRLATHLAVGRDAAEDLVQSTFLAAIESADRFAPDRRLVPWLLGILVNLARRDRARRAPLGTVEFDSLVHPTLADPLDGAAERELSAALNDALRHLRDPSRQALELYLRHGLTPSAIARVMRRPPGTVRSLLHRGLDELRRRLPAGYTAAAVAGTASVAWSGSAAAAAVRESVLAAAASPVAVAVPTSTAAAFAAAGGASMTVKKTGLLVAAFAVLAAVVVWTVDSTAGPDPRESAAAGTLVAVDAGAALPRPVVPEPTSPAEDGRVALAAPVPPAAASDAEEARSVPRPLDPARGRLVVDLRWKDDDSVAAGVGVCVRRLSGASASGTQFGVADARGVVRFDDVAPGFVSVRAFAGQGNANVQVRAGVETAVTVALRDRGLTVDGVVVDADGAVVGDANVWLSAPDIPSDGTVVTRSRADGTFTLSGLRKNQAICAWRDGYGPSECAVVQLLDETDETRRRVELVLRRAGGAVEGRVVDARGAAVARAVVTIQLVDTRAYASTTRAGWVMPPPPRRLRTDAEGRFAAVGLPAGRSAVVAQAGELCPARELLVLEDRTRAAVELELRAGATIRGVARDDRGAPLAHVEVRTGEWGAWGTRFARSRPDGTFELRGVQPGAVRLEASTRDRRRDATDLTVADGETGEWNPVLGHAGRLLIRGRVVDENGAPRVQWGVKVAARTNVQTTATDADGVFEFEGLRDADYALEVREPLQWLKPPVHRVTDVRPSPALLEITVPSDAIAKSALVGRLVAVDGGTLPPNCVVRVFPLPSGRAVAAELDAADGSFRIGELPAGDYRLIASGQGVPRDVRMVAATGGQDTDVGTIVLGATGALRATATLPNGEHLRDARGVAVLQSELDRRGATQVVGVVRNLAYATFDGSGQALRQRGDGFVADLAPGAYRVRVWGDNFAPFETAVRIDAGRESAPVWSLEPAVRVAFAFDLPPDAPKPVKLWVRARSGNAVVHDVEYQASNRPGRPPFAWTAGFASGHYAIEAETDTGLTGRLDLDVRPAADGLRRTVELR